MIYIFRIFISKNLRCVINAYRVWRHAAREIILKLQSRKYHFPRNFDGTSVLNAMLTSALRGYSPAAFPVPPVRKTIRKNNYPRNNYLWKPRLCLGEGRFWRTSKDWGGWGWVSCGICQLL